MRQEIRRIACIGTSGRSYTVVEFQNFRSFTPLSGRTQNVPTTKEMFLLDGSDVNFVDEGHFEIVLTGEKLTTA